jgi:hypothetical protein
MNVTDKCVFRKVRSIDSDPRFHQFMLFHAPDSRFPLNIRIYIIKFT